MEVACVTLSLHKLNCNTAILDLIDLKYNFSLLVAIYLNKQNVGSTFPTYQI